MNQNIIALKKACEELNLQYKVLDKDNLFLSVVMNEKEYFFIQNQVPLSLQVHSKIAVDKEYTYLLLKDSVPMPKTKGYLDPYVADKFQNYEHKKNYQEILNEILTEFTFPLILKRNSGSTGNNVFLVQNEDEALNAIEIILNKNNKDYDYILLAQEYLKIKKEFRVIILNGQIQFYYLKNNSEAEFVGNLSPLHWKGANAVLYKNEGHLFENISEAVSKIYSKFPIPYAGLDIIIDENDKLSLLEVNSHPAYEHFIADNGYDEVVKLYKMIFNNLDS